ncbi:hypothetical protein GJ496_002985 [Pomphorhynchus laevis]|nr:hypothetical protein GJ496_002985 [Pomphorhynchus laevis]
MKLGYKYFADGKLLSIFSAKNYGQHGGNDAAILKISRDLSFEIDTIPKFNKLRGFRNKQRNSISYNTATCSSLRRI